MLEIVLVLMPVLVLQDHGQELPVKLLSVHHLAKMEVFVLSHLINATVRVLQDGMEHFVIKLFVHQ